MPTNTMGSRLTKSGSDEDMGRWAWQRFKCHKQSHLTIFTAYQVSQKSAKGLGMETACMQQWRFLRAQNKATPVNPRAQFLIPLSVQLTHFQDTGDEIILMLDANSDFEDAQFLRMVTLHNLIDLHSNFHSLNQPPKSHRQGKKKIDSIFGSFAVSQAVTGGA